MKLKTVLFAAAIALSGAAVVSTPASAGLFSGVGKFVKGAVKTVTHTAAKVEHTVAHEAKVVAHTTSKVAKTVGHTAGTVARDVGRGIAKAPKVYMAVAKPVGKAVAAYYRFGAKVIEKTPLKGFAPLARDAARAALSKSGKLGFVVGAGLAVATGGASHLLLSAGAGAMTHYYGDKGIDIAKTKVAQAKAQVRATYQGIRRDIRTTAREIRTSMR